MILTESFQSRTNPNVSYVATHNTVTGHTQCTCPSWRYCRTRPRTCRHLRSMAPAPSALAPLITVQPPAHLAAFSTLEPGQVFLCEGAVFLKRNTTDTGTPSQANVICLVPSPSSKIWKVGMLDVFGGTTKVRPLTQITAAVYA